MSFGLRNCHWQSDFNTKLRSGNVGRLWLTNCQFRPGGRIKHHAFAATSKVRWARRRGKAETPSGTANRGNLMFVECDQTVLRQPLRIGSGQHPPPGRPRHRAHDPAGKCRPHALQEARQAPAPAAPEAGHRRLMSSTRSSPTSRVKGNCPARPAAIRSNASRDLPAPDGPRMRTARAPTKTAEAWIVPVMSRSSPRRRGSSFLRRFAGFPHSRE